ncbi:hypothetical protein CKM354_000217200 [Cercospora kikuchii]|nr:uncharacterized protein CKM354_000217200 [Cercospora kikuchii]GIZ38770.1 hypothetical protein CKM354_000217200 [Cercospora kikuchii]
MLAQMKQAEERAKQAEERAKQAEERAKQAEGRTKEAEKRAEQAGKRAAQAEEKLKQLEEIVAKVPTIEQITTIIQEQVAVSIQQQVAASIQEQLANVAVPTNGSRSYAEVARTPPDSQPSNIRSLTMSTTPSAFTNSLYCTIDISRADEAEKARTHPGAVRECIEREMRGVEGQERWRCVAVTKDPRNADRIRVACRSEGELAQVKEAMLKTAAATPGSRVLRDQLHPIKVDNANRTAVITETGTSDRE